MDDDPFLSINMLDIRENQVPELKKFCKSEFDIDSIFSTASELKYVHAFKSIFAAQLENPTDEFTRLFLQSAYSGQKTQSVIEKFRPILKKALNDQISEMMNDKIKSALGGAGGSVSASGIKTDNPAGQEPASESAAPEKNVPCIVTTEEELESYFIVKNLLSDLVDVHDITYKDTESYINVLYKGNTRKWICRLRLNDAQKILIIPDENKKDMRYALQDIYDISQYKDQLISVLSRYL